MKNVKIIEGVVAEYNGKFWGIQYDDGCSKVKDFGDLDNAQICNPEYCVKPTDMTWNSDNMYNPEYELLKKATLKLVRKTITTEIEIL